VDVACWGATLVSRSVVDAGVLPDPEWFFGLEDFDFFCRVREAGFEVLVDAVAARQVAGDQTMEGRDEALEVRRPTDHDEAWRSYYHARNSFALARRHGRASWIAWHLAYSVRQLQAAGSRERRAAILHGLWDGALGRMGEHSGYGRRIGEFGRANDSEPGSPATT
jgi:GT2 family glycosyltransferase